MNALSDSQGGIALREQAKQYFVEHQLAVPAAMTGDAVNWYISDDPTKPGHVFVTLIMFQAYSAAEVADTSTRKSIGTVLAVDIDRGTGRIVDGGTASWYEGQ